MKKISLQSLAITVFVFVLMWGVSKLADLKFFSAFDPISQALTDFELTDYAFSNMRLDPDVDQRIVLVNLAPNRALIAQQVMKISQHKPKVIGIDSFQQFWISYPDHSWYTLEGIRIVIRLVA